MMGFTLRNVKVYFRDRAAVLFSLLGVAVVVGLYVFFLGDNFASGFEDIEGGRLMVNAWLVAGVCAITPVTTGMGVLGSLVDDRARGLSRDFLASPARRGQLVGGYLLGGLAGSAVMSFAALLLGFVWLWASGAALPGLATLAGIVGAMLLAILSGGTMMFFLITFFKTNAAYTAAATIVGTVIGFLTGIYLPVGLLPAPVQVVVKLIPTSHAASLLRSLLMAGPAGQVFAGAPPAVMEDFYLEMGVRFSFGGGLFPLWGSVLVLAGGILLFFTLSVLNYARTSKP